MPNKRAKISVSVSDIYMKDMSITKSTGINQQDAMFEYVGDTLDYIALYDKKLEKGFALCDLNENSAEVNIAYLHDKDGELIEEEEVIWDLLDSGSRARLKGLIGGSALSGRDISLIYVDGYEDYEGGSVTKLLPLRRHFEI